MSAPSGVSDRTRRNVHVFLMVFVVTAVAHLELWPFTAFRLFSEVRPAEVELWHLVAVSRSGAETPIDLADLPIAYRTTTRVLDDFAEMSSEGRDRVCDGWLTPLREAGEDAERVRVYSSVRSVRPGAPPGERWLEYECGTPP